MMKRTHDFVRGHCSFCDNITSVGVTTKTGKGRCCMVCQRKMANIIGGQDKLEGLERKLEKASRDAEDIDLEELEEYRPQRNPISYLTVRMLVAFVKTARAWESK